VVQKLLAAGKLTWKIAKATRNNNCVEFRRMRTNTSWWAKARHPRLSRTQAAKSWMPTFVGMTGGGGPACRQSIHPLLRVASDAQIAKISSLRSLRLCDLPGQYTSRQ
jgi:hypothetical protein